MNRRAPLLRELCRVFNAVPVAMECALRHGQVSIDGYIIRPQHIERWPPERLRGRMATLVGRTTRLEFR